MKRRVRAMALSMAALLLCLARPAGAMSPDPTGLWYDPQESGWGLTVEQQQSTMFAVLFVYDASGRPAWYVASSIGGAIDMFPLPPPRGPFSGALYRTSGPYFGGPFDPHAVTMAQVGTISIGYPDPSGLTMAVTYDIDGVHVAKTVERQTWADGFGAFFGVYQGAAVVDGKSDAACPALTVSPPLGTVTAFNVQAVFGAHETRMSWGIGIDTACTVDGTYQQAGRFASIAGTLACGPVGGSATYSAAASLTEIAFDAAGFGARFRFQQNGCAYTGHLGGVRVAD